MMASFLTGPSVNDDVPMLATLIGAPSATNGTLAGRPLVPINGILTALIPLKLTVLPRSNKRLAAAFGIKLGKISLGIAA